ncbi:hypothetical protein DXG03_005940, partial [Asterophora parasitica]
MERRTSYPEPTERRTSSTDPSAILLPDFEAGLPRSSTLRRSTSTPRTTTVPLVDDYDHHAGGQAGPSRRAQTPRSSPTTTPPNVLLQHLDDQIHLLSAQIDAFREERAALLRVVDSQLHARNENVLEESVDEGDISLDPSEGTEGLDAELDGLGLDQVQLDDEEIDLRQLRREVELDESTDSGERSMDLETPMSTFVALPGAGIP